MSTGKNTAKPRLSRDQLEGHGIEFIEKVHKIDELDSWLQPIVRAITRLQGHFPRAARKEFSGELKEFHLRGQDREDARKQDWCLKPVKNFGYSERERYTTPAAEGDHLQLASCEQALLDVRLCRTRNENEDKWTQVLREHVFLDFHKTNKGSSTCEQKLNGWELHQNILWTEFTQWAELNPKIAQVTMPKPDFTYAFPVISPHDEAFRAFEGDHQVESFSLPVLGELRIRPNESLISAPTTALHNWAAKNKTKLLEAKDLMCFPWAIVEIKRGIAELVADDEHIFTDAEARAHKERTQFCYCQAANASAAGLTLREHLAARARDSSKLHSTRVMFSYTCVGSAVKLWITYRKTSGKRNGESQPWHSKGRIIMVCIWATSLELSWGIIALRMIVENVNNWVHARIKPEISRWIHDVRQNRHQACCLTPSGDMVVQRRRAASCEPTQETLASEKSGSQPSESRYRTPPRRTRPALPQAQTVPGSLNARSFKGSVPRIQLNGSMKSGGGEIDSSSDEGYASIHTEGRWETDEDERKSLSAFIDQDEPSEEDSDASYVPSSSGSESTESESVEDEEDDTDGASSSESLNAQEEIGDEYDLSDSGESYYDFSHRSHVSTRLEVYCTPVKGHQSYKATDNGSKEDRRRSSRF